MKNLRVEYGQLTLPIDNISFKSTPCVRLNLMEILLLKIRIQGNMSSWTVFIAANSRNSVQQIHQNCVSSTYYPRFIKGLL